MNTAHFGIPHLKVGFAACDSAALILRQRIGLARAHEYLQTGDEPAISITRQTGLIVKVLRGQHAEPLTQGHLSLQTRAGCNPSSQGDCRLA